MIAGSAAAQMMGPGSGGYGGCGGMMGGWWNSPPPQNAKALTIDQAADIVQNYLKGFWGADLKLAEVMEFDNQFYAEVREKSSGTGAFELLVNKWTGAALPEPGPNMMWNTKNKDGTVYGMLGVNGYNGWVWYHEWHGKFVGVKEY